MQDCEKIKNYAQSVLSEKRFAHTVNVAEEARRLALIWGVDPEKAYLAGLIHDIAKELSMEETQKLMEESDENLSAFDSVALHGFLAAYIAKTRLGVTDSEVLDAARYHTTGRVGMNMLEKIVYVADFTEPGRHYPQSAEVRKISERDIDEAVLREADYVIKFIIDSGRVLHTTTVEMRNSFLTKIKRG